MLKNKTVLVTGGAGFIGSHIVEQLVKDGLKVRVYDNFLRGNKHDNTILFDFETKQITNIDSFIDLQKKYKEYNDYYNYRHWIQYLDLSNISLLLPAHYKYKFIDNTLRNN